MATGSFLGAKEIATPPVQAALTALAAVPKGWDRVVAIHAAPRWQKWAENTYGPENKKASWWGWLLRKPIRDWANTGLPGDDHVEYREKDGKRVRISQPYDLSWDDLRRLVRHCEDAGLRCDIHGTTWWFPGWTLTVVVRPAKEPPP